MMIMMIIDCDNYDDDDDDDDKIVIIMVLITEIGDERWTTMYDEKIHYACIVFNCHLWETNTQIYRYSNIYTSFYKYI